MHVSSVLQELVRPRLVRNARPQPDCNSGARTLAEARPHSEREELAEARARTVREELKRAPAQSVKSWLRRRWTPVPRWSSAGLLCSLPARSSCPVTSRCDTRARRGRLNKRGTGPAGGAFAPFDALLPAPQLEPLLAHVRAVVVRTRKDLPLAALAVQGGGRAAQAELFTWDDLRACAAAEPVGWGRADVAPVLDRPASAFSLCWAFPTSGSSGAPRVALAEHAGAANYARHHPLLAHCAPRGEARLLVAGPHTFDPAAGASPPLPLPLPMSLLYTPSVDKS